MIELMIRREGFDKPFTTHNYVFNMFAHVLGQTVFSEKFEQKDLQKFKYCSTDFMEDLGNRLYLYEFVPVLRLFMKYPYKLFEQCFDEIKDYTRNIYKTHEKTYDKNKCRDFCDVLIATKLDAISEDRESAQYYMDENLISVMVSLFSAGNETSSTTFQWMILLMLINPEMHQKLCDEITVKLNDRIATISDKAHLDYVMAFICETLRYRNAAPIGDKYSIKENTYLVVHQSCILMDEKNWTDADKFNPDRFLDNHGKFDTVKPPAFIPFSTGRRICPGEQLAINNLFLILNLTQLYY
ncbi:unnamed protein product [Oppiella nova]|uniref:Cytochrome P450 n=1 Tax=Oppiella nova TaxID=334625 RepID=A0A7R9LJN3_9ACAR|nr:unnamed protein product [Oppiella nova]CAG2164301.1 unnamed protein product [Oppiella nova]